MNYALVENGVVTNVIWLNPGNANEFPNAVPIEDVPVAIGDTWNGENFYRNGERVVSLSEEIGNIINNLVGGISDVQS